MEICKIKTQTVHVGKRQFHTEDIVFVFLFLVLSVCFFLIAPIGLTDVDETIYQFSCFRLSMGEKLIADDWTFTQLSAVFLYLPYRLFTWITGSTEGLFLCMRYVYVCVKMLLFVCIYLSLRAYGWFALLAGAIYTGMDFFGIKTMGYYSICAAAVLLAALFLFAKKEKKPRHFILAGFLFSLAVIVEPFCAAVWFLYTLAVFVLAFLKKRNRPALHEYEFILSFRVWGYITLGVCLAAALFFVLCAAFFTGFDLKAIFSGIKRIVAYLNYESDSGSSTMRIRLVAKPLRYVRLYRPVLVLLFAIVSFVGVALHRFTQKHENLCFALLSVLFVLLSVSLIMNPSGSLSSAEGESVSHPLLLPCLAVSAHTFTRGRNRPMFAFLLFSFAVSVAVDLSSNNTFGSLLLPGNVPAVILLVTYVRERLQERGPRKKRSGRKLFAGVLCALLASLPCFEIWHYVYMCRLHETETIFCRLSEPLDTKITSGGMKGVVTTKSIAEDHANIMADIAVLREKCNIGLFVSDIDMSVYINAGLPVAAASVHISDSFILEEAWWEAHPDRRPDTVYIPYASLSYMPMMQGVTAEYTLAYFEKHADIRVSEGKMGYIVEIGEWKQ